MINVAAYLRMPMIMLTLILSFTNVARTGSCIETYERAGNVTINATVMCGNIPQADKEVMLLKDTEDEPYAQGRTDSTGRLYMVADFSDIFRIYSKILKIKLRFQSIDCGGETGEQERLCRNDNGSYVDFQLPKMRHEGNYTATIDLFNNCISGNERPSRRVYGRLTCNGQALPRTGVVLFSYAPRATGDPVTITLARGNTYSGGYYNLSGGLWVDEPEPLVPYLMIHSTNCAPPSPDGSQTVTRILSLENDEEHRVTKRTFERDIDLAKVGEWTTLPEVAQRVKGTLKCGDEPLANHGIRLMESIKGASGFIIGNTTTDSEGRFDISGSIMGPFQTATLYILPGACPEGCKGFTLNQYIFNIIDGGSILSRNCGTVNVHDFCTEYEFFGRYDKCPTEL